jgi:site-specific DNA recombinase
MSQRAVNGRLPAEAVRKFQRKSQKERLATLSEKAQAERQLAKVVKEIDNIVSAVSQVMFHPSMKAKMDELESDRADIEAKLASLPEQEPITIHPGSAEMYARKVSDLVGALNEDGTRHEAADQLRGFIEKIIVRPDPGAANGHVFELYE